MTFTLLSKKRKEPVGEAVVTLSDQVTYHLFDDVRNTRQDHIDNLKRKYIFQAKKI